MKILSIITIIIFAVFLMTNCFSDEADKCDKLTSKVTVRCGKKLEKEKQSLYFVGIGGRMKEAKIVEPYMGFQYWHEVSLEEGRELIVHIAQKYLTEFNNDVKLRSCLCEYPFTAQRLHIDIWFYKPDRSDPEPENIGFITLYKGKISYKLERKKDFFRELLHKETYEEALEQLKKVSEKQDSLPK